MNIYQRLQDLCNRQIEKGWKPRGDKKFEELVITEWGIIAQWWDDDYLPLDMRMHDLFSANSGFMESLEWKYPMTQHIVTKEEYIDEINDMHYYAMSKLKAEDKIKYVLDNVVTSEE